MASLKVVDHYITYRGVNLLSSFHLKIDGNQTFQTAKRDVERFAVPGRNGDLTIDGGRFDPFTLPYDAYIVDDWQKNSANLAAFLLQDAAPHRLEDTIHPDVYRMASFEGPFDPEVIWLSSGRFTLNFHCQPQCWLKIGERKTAVDDSAAVVLKNPTAYPAKPLIKVTQGTGMINVNDTIIQLTVNETGQTYIDCETEDAWEGANNRNGSINRITGDFPVLQPGENAVSVGSGMQIEVIPRWWTVL